MNNLRCIILLCSYLVSACNSEDYINNRNYSQGSVVTSSRETIFPESIKPIIDNEYISYIKSLGAPFDIQTDDEILSRRARDFINIDLYLYQESPGALSGNTHFKLPHGGGIVDLASVVRGHRGSFYSRFTFESASSPEDKLNNFKAYFLSGSEKRNIASETWGSGCRVFMEITRLVQGRGKKEGILANATDGRHAALLSGVYYFVSFGREKMYVASMEIKDTRFQEYSCSYVEKN